MKFAYSKLQVRNRVIYSFTNIFEIISYIKGQCHKIFASGFFQDRMIELIADKYSIPGVEAWSSENLSRENDWAGGCRVPILFLELKPYVLRTFQDSMIKLVPKEYSIPGTEAWGSENLSWQNDLAGGWGIPILFLELRPHVLKTFQDRTIELVPEEYLFFSWNWGLRFWEPFKTEWFSWWLRSILFYTWNWGLSSANL
jgi:hypothetical protein